MGQKNKNPRDSAVETRYIVMPDQANAYGTAFGGVIMSWIDMVGGMVAQRHVEGVAVTASIDTISFKAPIFVGDHVVLKAGVTYTGSTSVEVGVEVIRENPFTGESLLATTAHLTFVALDENKKPRLVPKLVPETEEELRRYREAQMRVEARKEILQKMKALER